MKIGFGYDIHRLKKNRPLILGGVKIKFPRGLDGHSDADVLIHAVMDAICGAAGLGDIGKIFPNSDPRYKNISSIELLVKIGQLARNRGLKISNIDSTIVAEEPRISGLSPEMESNIAGALKIKKSLVSVKATTNERLGDVGSKKGIAAFAVVLLY